MRGAAVRHAVEVLSVEMLSTKLLVETLSTKTSVEMFSTKWSVETLSTKLPVEMFSTKWSVETLSTKLPVEMFSTGWLGEMFSKCRGSGLIVTLRRARPHNAPDVQVARVGARAYGGGAKGAEKAAYLKAIAHGGERT
jgi:hypothetical protein